MSKKSATLDKPDAQDKSTLATATEKTRSLVDALAALPAEPAGRPLASAAGSFKDDPLWDAFQRGIEENRREADRQWALAEESADCSSAIWN